MVGTIWVSWPLQKKGVKEEECHKCALWPQIAYDWHYLGVVFSICQGFFL